MNIITTTEAENLRALNAAFEAWVDTKRNKRSGWASYRPEEVPEHLRAFTNEERAKLELYDFMTGKPERHFAYYQGQAERGQRVTNWTGLTIGSVSHAGQVFTSNMGDKRRHVTVQAVNGCTYKGIAQLSNGTYARLRKTGENPTVGAL